jgi:4-hydroxybenzoate polyprenyltransferase
LTDEPIDRINTNRTMFNGGTGLRLKGLITKTVLNRGWIISSLLALLIPALMVLLFGYHWLLLVGLTFQVGNPHIAQIVSNFRFYLLALPVSLSVFTTLCLTQIPDTDADKTIGKKSISVMIGSKNVLILSASSLLICVVLFIIFIPTRILSPGFAVIASVLPLLTTILILTNLNAYKSPAGMGMINIMGMSVISSIFCAVVPAIYHLFYFDQIATF